MLLREWKKKRPRLGEILTKHLRDKELVSKIYKDHSEKTNRPILKMDKKSEQTPEQRYSEGK